MGESLLVDEVFNWENFSFYGDFYSQLVLPSRTKRLSIDILDEEKISSHFLQRIVKDSLIRENTQSTPITEEQFFALSLLLRNPKFKLRTDDHLFHVSLNSGNWITVRKFFFNKPSYVAFPFNHPYRMLGSTTFFFLG